MKLKALETHSLNQRGGILGSRQSMKGCIRMFFSGVTAEWESGGRRCGGLGSGGGGREIFINSSEVISQDDLNSGMHDISPRRLLTMQSNSAPSWSEIRAAQNDTQKIYVWCSIKKSTHVPARAQRQVHR